MDCQKPRKLEFDIAYCKETDKIKKRLVVHARNRNGNQRHSISGNIWLVARTGFTSLRGA